MGQKNALQAVFGTGDNSPEHEAFYRAVGIWAKDFEEGCPDQLQRLETLRLLLFAAAEHEGSRAQWYLIAIQNWAMPLVAGLDDKGREILGREYANRYPKSRRMPSQTEILRKLTGKKEKGLRFFKK